MINCVEIQKSEAAVKWAGKKFYCPLQAVRLTHVLLLLLCAWMSPLHAANPPTINITRSVALNLKPDLAWGIVKDFSGLHRWHPGFTDTELIQGANGKLGALRVVAMKDGPRVSDQLLQYSEQSKRYRYRMVASPMPVEDYVGAISVRSKGKTSIVTWSVSFKRKKSSSTFTDADVKIMIDHLMQVGLANLKRMASNAA